MSFLDALTKPNIEKLIAKRDVPGLIKALSYREDSSDWDVRHIHRKAAQALSQIGDPRAVESLIAALKDRDKEVRCAAAQALGMIKDSRAVEPLSAALKDSDVCQAAGEALVQIGALAVEPLIAALKDKNSDLRQAAAAEALEKLGWQPGKDDNGAWYWIVKKNFDKCIEIGTPAVEPLSVALKDKAVRRAVIEALGKLGDARAVKPLIAILEDADLTAVVEALVQLGAPAVMPLSAALKIKNWRVRQVAAEALVRIGTPAVEPLIAALKDGDGDVRQAAAEALVQIGATAVEPLIAALKAAVKDKNGNARQAAAEALVRIGVPAVESLIAALKDRDGDVRLSRYP